MKKIQIVMMNAKKVWKNAGMIARKMTTAGTNVAKILAQTNVVKSFQINRAIPGEQDSSGTGW